MKAIHLRKIREYILNTSDTFRMPANASRKPDSRHRDRIARERNIVVERIEKSTTGNKPALYHII